MLYLSNFNIVKSTTIRQHRQPPLRPSNRHHDTTRPATAINHHNTSIAPVNSAAGIWHRVGLRLGFPPFFLLSLLKNLLLTAWITTRPGLPPANSAPRLSRSAASKSSFISQVVLHSFGLDKVASRDLLSSMSIGADSRAGVDT